MTHHEQHAAEALQYLDPGCNRNEWFRALAAAKSAGLDLGDVDAWSSTAGNYGGSKDVAIAWRSIKDDGVGAGTLFFLARQAGWTPSSKRTPQQRSKPVVHASVQPAVHESLSDYGRRLWGECQTIHGVGADYLQARHCVIPPEDGDLLFHPELKHPSGYAGPALVALVTDAVTREPISLHRTWICADGSKAKLDPPRMLLGGHRKQGGVIRLWPDETVTYGLGIAEGVETALSLAHAYAPVWALIDAGNLAALPVLVGVESLVIGADRDPAGEKAARACATRWADADREVLVTRQAANDLNDVLREVAHAG